MKVLLAMSPFVASASNPVGVVVADKDWTYTFSPFGDYCMVLNYAPSSADLSANGVDMGGNGMTDMEQCATQCTNKATCKSWAIVDTGSGNHQCWDTTAVAPDPNAPGVIPLEPSMRSMTGLAGKCVCPQDAQGTVLTDANFPPEKSKLSDYATLFDESAHGPGPLSCWPKSKLGVLKNAPVTTQRSNQGDKNDKTTFFHGWCDGLTGPISLAAGDDCESNCINDPECNGFQHVPNNGLTGRAEGCYQGAGYNCDKDNSDANGMVSKRYTRGFVNVIATLTTQQILGLEYRFEAASYTKKGPVKADGTQDDVTDWDYVISRCKEICYADLWCTAWQAVNAAPSSNPPGCYTEAQAKALPYPLTKDQVTDVSNVPDAIMGGEYIQHWYSEDWTTTTTTTTTVAQSNLLPILAGLGALAALLGLLAYAMGWCSPKEKPKKRAKRALQPEPVKEEPKPEPVPTQPSFLMSAPVLTYTAPPVTYAPPIATHAPVYAAPPVTTASYAVVPQTHSVVVPQEPVVHTGFMG
jgi:hypothetical protein